MRRFRFRLERLLRLREVREDASRRALAGALAAHAQENARLAELRRATETGRQRLREACGGGPAWLLSSLDGCTKSSLLRERAQGERERQAAGVVETRRAELGRRRCERRAVENLKRRRSADHRLEGTREEARLLDEIAVRAASRGAE